MKTMLRFVPEGDQILRKPCRKLFAREIKSDDIQQLIDDMFYTVAKSQAGVGLSANQVGRTEAISVVAVKPTPARPQLTPFNKVYINTEVVETFGECEPMWEGCLSTAVDENGESAMAQVPRFRKIRVEYYDRDGEKHNEIVEGFLAHVLQHETDHLNGILFTDLIDKDTLIPYREYVEKYVAS